VEDQEKVGKLDLEYRFKAAIVWFILNGEVERALDLLARRYGVDAPKLEVGLPKGRRKRAYGCYNGRKKTISVLSSDTLRNPFVILHEFYHHLRTDLDLKHRGTEKRANAFALEFIQVFESSVAKSSGND